MTVTVDDAIKAATSVARDVAEGRLSPSDLEAQAVSELRELVGTVIGPDDPLWPLQVDVARQAVSHGALSPDELREWAAVLDRQRGVEPSEPPAPPVDPSTGRSSASEAASPQESLSGVEVATPDAEASVAAVASFAAALARFAGEASEASGAPVDPSEPVSSASGAASGPESGSGTDGYDATRGWQPGNTRRL